jgi:hypothetical protein
MKERKPYEKPAVVFEKELEALAGLCDPTGAGLQYGTGPNTCKTSGVCSPTVSS